MAAKKKPIYLTEPEYDVLIRLIDDDGMDFEDEALLSKIVRKLSNKLNTLRGLN